jgi:hypothetical protein
MVWLKGVKEVLAKAGTLETRSAAVSALSRARAASH